MNRAVVICACGVLGLGFAVPGMAASGPLADAPQAPASPQPTWAAVQHSDLKVTCGEVLPGAGHTLSVGVPKVRAVLRRDGPPAADLRFTYLGPTSRTVALRSGNTRTQIGVKLLAQDACNLVYVMWRLMPVPTLVVSTKLNPDAHQTSSCGTQGYRTIRPTWRGPLPTVLPGSKHRLQAMLEGNTLKVLANEALVWRGPLGASRELDGLHGPVGLRTDNGRFAVELWVPQHTGSSAEVAPAVKAGHDVL